MYMITSPKVVNFISANQKIVRQQTRRSCSVMENHTTSDTDKVYFHYNHTDSCKFSRWNARESYLYMYERPWQQVVDFYTDVVKGQLPLSTLIPTRKFFDHKDAEVIEPFTETETASGLNENKTGRWARVTYKITVSYHGGSFDGWQRQPGLNTVQGVIERSLGRFVDERKAELLKTNGSAVDGSALVAGRTDKGVTALLQVCSFYTWRKDVSTQEIQDAINSAAPGRLRVISVFKVSRAFHPNFSAKWRRYLYLFPLNDGNEGKQINERVVNVESVNTIENHMEGITECAKHLNEENIKNLILDDKDVNESGMKPRSFSICRVNQLLCQLEGKLLSYKMFARDTKASRNE